MKRFYVEDADSKANVHINAKLHKRWPAFKCSTTRFAITMPSAGREPMSKSSWLVITHQPTGYRVCDATSLGGARKIAAVMAAIFGEATTNRGVMRKYRKLPEEVKDWISSMAIGDEPK